MLRAHVESDRARPRARPRSRCLRVARRVGARTARTDRRAAVGGRPPGRRALRLRGSGASGPDHRLRGRPRERDRRAVARPAGLRPTGLVEPRPFARARLVRPRAQRTRGHAGARRARPALAAVLRLLRSARDEGGRRARGGPRVAPWSSGRDARGVVLVRRPARDRRHRDRLLRGQRGAVLRPRGGPHRRCPPRRRDRRSLRQSTDAPRRRGTSAPASTPRPVGSRTPISATPSTARSTSSPGAASSAGSSRAGTSTTTARRGSSGGRHRTRTRCSSSRGDRRSGSGTSCSSSTGRA